MVSAAGFLARLHPSRALAKPCQRGETDGLIDLSARDAYPRVWTRKDARGTAQAARLRVGGAVCAIIVTARHVTIGRIIRGRHGAKEPGRLHARTTCRRSPESGLGRNRLLDPRRKNPRIPRSRFVVKPQTFNASKRKRAFWVSWGSDSSSDERRGPPLSSPDAGSPPLRQSPIFALRRWGLGLVH